MAAIGSVWGTGTWTDDIWADGTWGDAVAATVPPAASGGGGGGSTQNQPNRRADFDTLGRSRREPEPKPVKIVARENADEIIAKAQEIAREKAALNALKEAQRVEKSTQAKMARAIAAEEKLAKLEADMAILRDDEEFLRIFLKML